MNLSINRDSRGMAHIMIVMVVVLVAAVGGVGYYVMKKQDDKKPAANSSPTAKASEDACNKLYDDKDLCKFSSTYSGKGPYTVTFTSTDKDGKMTKFTTSIDAKDNSSTITSDGSTETSAFISLDGDTYLKDPTDGSWTKYPRSPETAAAETQSPIADLKIDTNEANVAVDQRITYKKLGKEACGSNTCFKYQVIDPTAAGTESIVWFSTKDYRLYKWSFKDTDGSTSVGEFSYGDVKIVAPSPVKEAPSLTAEDVQAIMDAAQAASGDQ